MNAIFIAFMNGAIASVLIALVVWLWLRVVARRALNAATRYVIWWVTLAVTLLLPLTNLPSPLRTIAPPAMTQEPITPPLTFAMPSPGSLSIHTSPLGPEPSRPRHPLLPLHIPAGVWPGRIFALWALAAGLMLARLFASYLELRRRKQRALAAPSQLAGRLKTWMLHCSCTRKNIRLASSAEIATPMLAGLLRPSILFPIRLLDELRDAELDQIGLHETAHLARWDDYALILQRVLEALFVFHPVARWIARQIDLDREIACDDVVLRATGAALPYAACLTRIVELTGGVRGSLAATAVVDGRSHLSRRIDHLLNPTRPRGTQLLKTRLAVVAAVIVALTALAARAPGWIAFSIAPTAFAAPAPPPATPADAPAPPVAAPQPAVPIQQPARAAVPAPNSTIVRTAVTVRDPLNRVVTGLTAGNFKILEDGVEQTIAEFSSERTPLSVGIVVDVSGSMRTHLAEAQQAVAQFLRAAGPGDEFFLATFNHEPRLLTGFTSDAAEIQNQLSAVEPRGGTALWEGVDFALRQMESARNNARTLLVFSDDADNSSSLSRVRVEATAMAAHVQIDAIDYSAGRIPEDLAFLEHITSGTGGHLFTASHDPGMVASLAVHNVYWIAYQSTNPIHDGHFHTIRVLVTPPPGLPPLTVRTRSGYYAN